MGGSSTIIESADCAQVQGRSPAGGSLVLLGKLPATH